MKLYLVDSICGTMILTELPTYFGQSCGWHYDVLELKDGEVQITPGE